MIYNSDIKSFKINYNKKIIEALNKLSFINPPILFVVDKKNHLVGTVTDGDIRRHILRKNAVKLSKTYSWNKIASLFYKRLKSICRA